MARITVEDCLDKVENRFSLVLLVSKRAKQLLKGSKLTVKSDNNKYVVSALREVADGRVYFNTNVSDLPPLQQMENDLNRLN